MRYRYLAVCFAMLAAGATAQGQAGAERFERQLEQIRREMRLMARPEVPPGQRALVDYGAFLSFNLYAVDDVLQDTHILRRTEAVAYARLNMDNVHEFYIRGRGTYDDYNSGDSFDGKGDEADGVVELCFYRFDLGRALAAYRGQTTPNNLVVQLGRQFVHWGNGLVLSDTLDGGMVELTAGPLRLELLGGVSWRHMIDFDASRPGFEDNTERGFYGGMLSAQVGAHRPFAYVLVQRDYNDEGPQMIGAAPTRFSYDSWYAGIGAQGSFGNHVVYGVEFAWEGGRGLSSSFDPATLAVTDQTREDIEAAALDVRLDYLFGDARRSRLSLETVLASGDDDRLHTSNTFGGNRSGTKDHAFNAFGLINTSFAFAPNVSNLTAVRLGASTFPFGDTSGFLRQMQVGIDLFIFGKFNTDGGFTEPTTDDWYLGWEPDVYMNWQITSDIALALRYGVFFPGSAIVNDEHPRNFFFAGITFSF